eukprot:scpid29887/ scgid24144/ 
MSNAAAHNHVHVLSAKVSLLKYCSQACFQLLTRYLHGTWSTVFRVGPGLMTAPYHECIALTITGYVLPWHWHGNTGKIEAAVKPFSSVKSYSSPRAALGQMIFYAPRQDGDGFAG